MEILERILHVEDDADIREIARMALELVGGLTVLQCEDGPQAVAQAAAFDPQIMLLDVMMPGMSGEETLAALRNDPKLVDCPAVFVTAKAQDSEIEALLKRTSASGVIVKPFDPTTLADQVRGIWDRQRIIPA